MHIPNQALPFDLNGRVAFITGVNHGIGAAMARALAGCGASVLATHPRSPDPDDYPEPYRSNRTGNADEVLAATHERGGRRWRWKPT